MISIAIDGPSGAGKSTIARAVAKELGLTYVDTGALYRAIGLFAKRSGICDTDEKALGPRLKEAEISISHKGGAQRVFLCGEDVSEEIRRPEMSMAASNVSAMPPVRAFLLELQREMARRHSVIMDGRDIGTVVIPGADLKIFLTASPEDRAKRRYKEFIARGEKVEPEAVLRDIIKRDHNDSTRAESPLRRAPGAVLLDTTGNTLDESVELVLKTIKEYVEL
ncbi:MAG: (d)CMP kinase [Oscillospiraceae bacterium]|nr:(d)CMP kinase [Oscillospiraceae bacterium]